MQQLSSFLPCFGNAWDPTLPCSLAPNLYLARACLPWKGGAAGCSPPYAGLPLRSSKVSSWVEWVLQWGEGRVLVSLHISVPAHTLLGEPGEAGSWGVPLFPETQPCPTNASPKPF